MPEVLLYDNGGGEIGFTPYELNPLTKYLNDAYDLARQPWPLRIINAWDFVITNIQANSGVSVGRVTVNTPSATVTDTRFANITGSLIVLNESTIDYALAGITIAGSTMTFPSGIWPTGFQGNIDFTYNGAATSIPAESTITLPDQTVRLQFTNEGDFTFNIPAGGVIESIHLESDSAETFTVGTTDGGTDVMGSTTLASDTIGNYEINQLLSFTYQKNVYFSGLVGNITCAILYKL